MFASGRSNYVIYSHNYYKQFKPSKWWEVFNFRAFNHAMTIDKEENLPTWLLQQPADVQWSWWQK